LRIRDRSINRSREKSRVNSRLEGVLSRREKLSKEKSWTLQTEGGGGEEPGRFPSSSSRLENGFFRREKREFLQLFVFTIGISYGGSILFQVL